MSSGSTLHRISAGELGHVSPDSPEGLPAGQAIEYCVPGTHTWLCATNYRLCVFSEEDRPSVCWRYDSANRVLRGANGILSSGGAMALLEDIQQETEDHQGDTQWSVVYGLRSGEIRVAMGRHFDRVYSFQLPLTDSAAGAR